jgi:uncharacterized integral membrane protein
MKRKKNRRGLTSFSGDLLMTSEYLKRIVQADIRECRISRAIIVIMIILVEAVMTYTITLMPTNLYSLELALIIMIYMLGGGVFVLRSNGKRLEQLREKLASFGSILFSGDVCYGSNSLRTRKDVAGSPW